MSFEFGKNISFYVDGERANQEVFNRPIKQLINQLKLKFRDLEVSSNSGFVIPEDKVTDPEIADGKVVYLKTDGSLGVATNDGSEKSNVLGIYKSIILSETPAPQQPQQDAGAQASPTTGSGPDAAQPQPPQTIVKKEHRVITYGIVDIAPDKNIEIAKKYYLGENGEITDSGTSIVGICVAPNKLFVNTLLSSEGGGGGSANLAKKEILIQDGKTEYDAQYTPNKLLVYLEGILLSSREYVANNGTSITLNITPKAGDILTIVT